MLVSIAHESAVNSLRLDRTVYYWYRVDWAFSSSPSSTAVTEAGLCSLPHLLSPTHFQLPTHFRMAQLQLCWSVRPSAGYLFRKCWVYYTSIWHRLQPAS